LDPPSKLTFKWDKDVEVVGELDEIENNIQKPASS
jgi:hypothetical protein